MDQTTLKATLEGTYQEWAALGPDDSGRKLTALGELFETVYELFPGHGDEINTIFMGEWKTFDPSKGSVYGFFASRIRLREKDGHRREQAHRRRTVEADADAGDGDAGRSLLDGLPAGPGSDPEAPIRLDAAACELIAAILELPQRLQGRAGNAARCNYFRMFFTDNIATYLHQSPEAEVFQRRERALFSALKLEFLDYFMAERCRSVEGLCRSALKPYGELVEGRELEETRLPLPGDVYTSYLERVEGTTVRASAVSQQKQFYLREVRKWLL